MFKHILVPLDGSSLAESVVPHVLQIAQSFDSKVTCLHVLEQPKQAGEMQAVDPLGWEFRTKEVRMYLSDWTYRLQEVGVEVESVILEGPAAERIAEFALRHDVDLIALSSHGQSGLSSWNVSSVVQKVLLRGCTSIMIVRAYEFMQQDWHGVRYQRILVPLDGSQRAEMALPVASTLADHCDAQLVLAH
ncbi:MAG: universal stress protein, partial [Chloroflexota bacterium]|nr:universal stress protein [Chloroflexota bacterium]